MDIEKNIMEIIEHFKGIYDDLPLVQQYRAVMVIMSLERALPIVRRFYGGMS